MSIHETPGYGYHPERSESRKSHEYLTRNDLIGMSASQFSRKLLGINFDLIKSGGVYEYPVDLARRHFTKTEDHKPRTLTDDKFTMLRKMRKLRTRYSEGYTSSIALGFELNSERFGLPNPTCASLIGIDVEAQATPDLAHRLGEYCRKNRERFVLFQAAERSFFIVMMQQLYRNNIYLFKDYLDFVEGFDGFEKISNPFYDFVYGRAVGDIHDPDYGAIAQRIESVTGHQGDVGHDQTFDLRHFAKSTRTNTRSRANPIDPRAGCDFQFCWRIGEKTGSDEFKVIDASDKVPMRFENLKDGSIMVTPEVFYNCGLS